MGGVLSAVGGSQVGVHHVHAQLLGYCVYGMAGGPATMGRSASPHGSVEQVLTFEETMQVWKSMSFVGHIIMLGIVAAGWVLPKNKRAKGTNTADKKEH